MINFDLDHFSKGMDAQKYCILWDGEGMPVIRFSGTLMPEFIGHLRIKIQISEEQHYIYIVVCISV
jgi:hypothetical protein